MYKALITGIEGFTGRYLALELSRLGYDVVGLGLPAGVKNIPLERYEQIDMMQGEALGRLLDDVQPDLVFHLAGISHVQSSPEALYRVNIVASRNLLAGLAGLPKVPKAVILASTANLYGNVEGIINESAPLNPQNDYAVSKLAMEYMAHIWRERLPVTVVRPFNYTGKGQPETFLIPKLVRHFRERLPVLELGNTDIVREFNDVRDVAAMYVRLALKGGSWGPFNLCSGKGYALKNILNILQNITGYCPEIRVNLDFVRDNEVKTLVGSPERLKQYIGVLPVRQLEDTLRWMIESEEA